MTQYAISAYVGPGVWKHLCFCGAVQNFGDSMNMDCSLSAASPAGMCATPMLPLCVYLIETSFLTYVQVPRWDLHLGAQQLLL